MIDLSKATAPLGDGSIAVVETGVPLWALDAGQVQGELGISGLMELVILAGQYRMIAGVLFAFDPPIPEGERAPF